MRRRSVLLRTLLGLLLAGHSRPAAAHDGPPFPIVSDHVSGAYVIDVWTDPDSTDDGTAGGQFWVVLDRAGTPGEPPPGTIVTVSIRPRSREGPWRTGRAEAVDGRVSRQFATLVMDHEGRFDVRVDVDGPLGRAEAAAWVDATYDLRPPPVMLVLYLMPFLAVGVLWMKLLIKRRRSAGATARSRSAPPRDR